VNHIAARVRRAHLIGLICLFLIALSLSAAGAPGDEYLVYVGTYTGKGSEGIYVYRFNAATGDSHPVGLAAETDNPSFLAVDTNGQFLYAVNEIDKYQNKPSGAVSVFAVDRETGKLGLLQQVPSLGAGPAHVSLDRSGRFLMVANYGGGNVAVFPIDSDGRLGEHTAFVQAHGSSVNPRRQAGPHAHSIQVTPDNRLAIVADLGIDKLLVYDFDGHTGALKADSLKFRTMDAGAGPRHVAFTPSGKFVYVANEMSSSVTAFAYVKAEGRLEKTQVLTTLPGGFAGTNTAAEIIVDSQGRFLYVSNRGDDSIVVFSIDPGNGDLTTVQRIPCGGKVPRNIALDPTGRWLFSANQRSDEITLFRVGPDDGRLTATSRSVHVVSPVCVTFAPRPWSR